MNSLAGHKLMGIRDQHWEVLTYAEVQHALSMFSGLTATEGMEGFRIQFEQICGNNEIPQRSWGWLLFSKVNGEQSSLLQCLLTVEQGNYDEMMGEHLKDYGNILVNHTRKAFLDDVGEVIVQLLR